MRTYKETLGIIKRATPFVNLPLTGPITAGVNRAADDIARGLDMQGALRTAVQVPQQAGSNFLSGIGNWMPLLFGMGGLGSLLNSNNTQIQPQPQKQVPAQTAPTTSTWDTIKNTAGKVWQGTKDVAEGVWHAYDNSPTMQKNFNEQMSQVNNIPSYIDTEEQKYRKIQKSDVFSKQLKDMYKQDRQKMYQDQMNRLRQLGDSANSWTGTLKMLW